MVTTSLVMPTTQGRYDLYGPIHKGLRRAHGLMLVRLKERWLARKGPATFA